MQIPNNYNEITVRCCDCLKEYNESELIVILNIKENEEPERDEFCPFC